MFDIVVIGGGITGTSLSALLSKKLRVLLVEKNSYLGGRAATRTPKEWGWGDSTEYRVDYGHHMMAAGGFLEYTVHYTGADKYVNLVRVPIPYFYRMNKFYQAPVSLLQQIKAYDYMPLSGKLRLFRFLRFVKKTNVKEVIEKYAYTSLKDLFDEFNLRDYERELLLDGFAAGYQTVAEENKNSAADLILCLKLFFKGLKTHRTPLLYPYGGFSNLSKAFAKIVEENNGKVVLNTKVEKILVNSENRVTGVKLSSGEKMNVKRVVIAFPIYESLPLFDDETIEENNKFFNRVRESRKNASSLFLILMGAKTRLKGEILNTWIFVPRQEIDTHDTYMLISETGEKLGVAKGMKTVTSFAVLYEHGMNVKVLEEKIRRNVGKLFPSFNFEEVDWKASHIFPVVDGVARTIDWYHEKRFGPETPIKGLYVAGDSAYELSTGTDGCASSALLTKLTLKPVTSATSPLLASPKTAKAFKTLRLLPLPLNITSTPLTASL